MRAVFGAALAALLVCGGAPAAAGPMACSPRAAVLAQLGAKYKEAPVAVGLASNGGLLEVLTSADGATWTIIVSMPGGISCFVAAGRDWQPLVPRPPGDGT